MKNKFIIFKILLIIILICLISLHINIALASTTEIDINPGDYSPGSTSSSSSSVLGEIGDKIFSVIRFIGSVVSIGVLMVIGIKYMTGSVEEKAEYKKTMKPYLIGAIMVFGIVNLLGVLVQLVSGVFS